MIWSPRYYARPRESCRGLVFAGHPFLYCSSNGVRCATFLWFAGANNSLVAILSFTILLTPFSNKPVGSHYSYHYRLLSVFDPFPFGIIFPYRIISLCIMVYTAVYTDHNRTTGINYLNLSWYTGANYSNSGGWLDTVTIKCAAWPHWNLWEKRVNLLLRFDIRILGVRDFYTRLSNTEYPVQDILYLLFIYHIITLVSDDYSEVTCQRAAYTGTMSQ